MFMAIVSVLITEHTTHHIGSHWMTFVVCSHNFIPRAKKRSSNEKHQTTQKTLHFYWLFAIISPFSLLRVRVFRGCFCCFSVLLDVYTWHIIDVFGRNPINLDTVINEYKYEMHEQKTRNTPEEVTKQDNVCDAHAQHPTCCDHFEIELNRSSQMNFIYWYEAWSSMEYKWNALHWLQLQFWVAVNATCVLTTIASHRTLTHIKNEYGLTFVWRMRKCGADGFCCCSIRAQIGDILFVSYESIDTTNLSSIRCYLTPSGLFWFTSHSERFWFFSLCLFSFSLVCCLGCLLGKWWNKSENWASTFFFFEEKKMFLAAERCMNVFLNAHPIYSKHSTFAMLQCLNSWVILKSSFKKMLNAYCIIGRIAHGNAFRCAFLDSELCEQRGGKPCTSRAATKSSTAFAHTGWPFVVICVACAFTIVPSFLCAACANFISKMLDDFVRRLFHTWERHKQRPKNESKKRASKLLSKEQSQQRINVVQTDTNRKKTASDIVTSSSKCRFVLRLICFFFYSSSLRLPSAFTSH